MLGWQLHQFVAISVLLFIHGSEKAAFSYTKKGTVGTSVVQPLLTSRYKPLISGYFCSVEYDRQCEVNTNHLIFFSRLKIDQVQL